jgi:hydroxymethylbilane synthase
MTSNSPWSPGSVVLAAHGGGDDAAANLAVATLADAVGAAAGLTTRCAFTLGNPGFVPAIADTPPGDVLVLPVMTSDGYFVRDRLVPAAVSAARASGRTAAVAPPIGLDPALHAATADRFIRAVCAAGGPMPTSVLVVGHGTRRHPGSGATTRLVADTLRRMEPAWTVGAAFLDQDPLLEDAASTLRGDLAVLPWLLGGAGHELDDLRERTGAPPEAEPDTWNARRTGGKVLLGRGLLGAPELLDACLREIAATRSRLPLRLGTRPSTLAQWQAQRAAAELARAGVPTRIVTIQTRGDRDRTTPIDDLGPSGLFTDELEAALRDRRIDAAAHSLKDLPLTARPDASLPALLERDHAEEVLVSRTGRPLRDLPEGAVVATSSRRRARQIEHLRGDLRAAPIRGTIEDRVRQVDEGRFDATVLAAAGLERLGMHSAITERFELDRLTPEAGQGIIALQTRDDDWEAAAMLGRADHPPTREAALAELAFARAAEAAGFIPAVSVSIASGGWSMTAALINPSTGRVERARFHTATAHDLLTSATRWAALRPPVAQEASS